MHRKALAIHWGPFFQWVLLSFVGIFVSLIFVKILFAPKVWIFKNTQQVVSLSVVISIIFGTITMWEVRTPIAMGGSVVLVLFKILTINRMIEHMDINLIIFLIGMMIIVEYMDRSGLFSWITVKMLNTSGFRPHYFVPMFIVLTAVMGAIVDEVTTILFMMAVVLTICKEFDEDPVFYTIITVFAVNIGSSMTAVGNPIGVFIALNAHPRLTFMDFIRYAAPNGLLNIIVLIFISLFFFVHRLRRLKEKIVKKIRSKFGQERLRLEVELTEAELEEARWDEWEKVHSKKHFYIAAVVLFLLVLLLSIHAQIENSFGFHADTMLILTPLLLAGVVLFIAGGEEAREMLEKGVDWWTLLYFMFLLPAISSLEYTGVIHKVADLFSSVAEHGILFTSIFIYFFAAIVSAWIDNFPVVVAITPVVQMMINSGMAHGSLLWWSLLFGGCYGGNLTMIGSTANIVALGVLERELKIRISFFKWLGKGSIIFATTSIVSILWIYLLAR